MLDEVYDLFIYLDATEEQIDFPVLFAVARDGLCGTDPDEKMENLVPLFETILKSVPAPGGEADSTGQVMNTNVRPDTYSGPLAISSVINGRLRNRGKGQICGPVGTFTGDYV